MFTIIEHSMSLIDIMNILNTKEISPQELIKCALGIKRTEIQAYCILVNHGPISIQDAADYMVKSRSTAQRLLQNLVEKGLATREEELIGLGGYKFIYKPISPETLKEIISRNLDEWYKRMQLELENLPEKISQIDCSYLLEE
jgi:predicted transcriptional regulator